MEIENFQIDNMINDEMPVVIGARQYYDKHLQVASLGNLQSNLSTFYRVIEDENMYKRKRKKA